MNRSVGLPIFSLAVGLIAALGTLPRDTIEPGAIRTSAILFALGLILPSFVALIRDGVDGILRTEWVVVYGVVYFTLLDVIQGLYPLDVPREAVVNVFLAISLFIFSLWIAVAQRPLTLPKTVVNAAATQIGPEFLIRLAWACFALGIFYFAFMSGFSPVRMINGLTGNRWSAPWARGSIGNWFSIIEQLQYFGYLLPTVTAMIAIQEGSFLAPRTLQSIVLSLLFMPFLLQNGSRRIFGMLIGGAVFTWLCSVRRKLRLQHVIVLLALTGVCLIIMDAMLATRSAGIAEYSYSLDEFHSVKVDDNFLRFAQIIDLVPARYPHPQFHWLLFVIARPIPRVFWPNKPLDPGFNLSEAVGITASLTCTSVGEWYEAFGWFGLIVGGFGYGKMARWWHQVLDGAETVPALAIYSVGLMAIAVSIRSTIELILMSFPLFALLLLLRFMGTPPAPAPSFPVTGYRLRTNV